jgi:hypothetical protein
MFVDDTLHLACMISNPARYKRRYELFFQWAEKMRAEPHVQIYVGELQQRSRSFVLDTWCRERGIPWIGFNSSYEVWHKENILNLVMQRLIPEEADHIGWMDCDSHPVLPGWGQEALNELQRHPVVQLFSHSVDLGPQNQPILQRRGFAHAYLNGEDMTPPSRLPYNDRKNAKWWHPGYGWAFRRDFLHETGGLMELAVVGSGDFHMAYGMIGLGSLSFPPTSAPMYEKMVLAWQDRAMRSARGNIGYVDTTINHFWHGKRADRRYADRWKIITDHQFDPYEDVVRDVNGVLRLTGTKPGLRLDSIRYHNARNEDSIDE